MPLKLNVWCSFVRVPEWLLSVCILIDNFSKIFSLYFNSMVSSKLTHRLHIDILADIVTELSIYITTEKTL